MINRCVAVVRDREPMVSWLRGLPDPDDVTLSELNQDPSAYLLPEFETGEEREAIFEVFYGPIFEYELGAWWTDEAAWPEPRTLSMFRLWFDVELHACVEDLADIPLLDDDA